MASLIQPTTQTCLIPRSSQDFAMQLVQVSGRFFFESELKGSFFIEIIKLAPRGSGFNSVKEATEKSWGGGWWGEKIRWRLAVVRVAASG